jgi:drug/metabolite transporter (DMT)-like permease
MGNLAGLLTSVFWAFGSVLFTIGGRRVGSMNVNRARLLLAVVMISTTHFFVEGQWFPFGAGNDRLLAAALSGIVGFVIGDAMLFQAFVIIGPRLSMLVMSLAPVFTVFLGWIFLGEKLSFLQLLAVAITIIGIIWVVLGRDQKEVETDRKKYFIGILAGLGGAIGQAVGLILLKPALGDGFSALSALVVRLVAAMIVLWLITILQGKVRHTLRVMEDRRGALAIVGASIVGPFIGVWLSIVALENSPAGIASTLMALPPVFLIPIVRVLFKEKVSRRAIFGTGIAFLGVALIFLLP